MPNILPLSNGGVQIEWHRNQWDVEIEIAGPYQINVSTYDLSNDLDNEFSLKTINVEGLRGVLEKIARR